MCITDVQDSTALWAWNDEVPALLDVPASPTLCWPSDSEGQPPPPHASPVLAMG